MKLLWCLALLFCIEARADVDLDAAFLRATGSAPAVWYVLDSGTWDGSQNFPPIVKQAPFGACQSFSMSAMMEYLFYRQTGKTVKLSEKYMAYSLLKVMIGHHYDEEKKAYSMKPNLGFGVAPLVIEAVARDGVMPNADYAWGEFEQDGSQSIDKELFDKIFEKPERDYSPEEYTAYLDQAFLSPPPRAIRYSYKQMDFSSGKEESVVVKSPLEMAKLAGFNKAKFTVLHNNEMNPTHKPLAPADKAEVMAWLESEAKHFGVAYETTAFDQVVAGIMKSLNSRMVVLLATDVWMGDWKSRVVYEGGGGHGVVIVGYQYREGELYFKLRNSWGAEAGIGGYNYIRASDLRANTLYVMLYDVK